MPTRDAGRLTEPMRYEAASDRYVPCAWDDAFAMIDYHLKALASPHEAEFYTSGHTSNKAAFLYSIFVREFGTNNFPDCWMFPRLGLFKATHVSDAGSATDRVDSLRRLLLHAVCVLRVSLG